MAGKLITLPLRVSFRSAQLLTRVAVGTAEQALALAGRTIQAVAPSPPAPQPTAPVPPPPPREAPPREAPPVRAVSSIRTPRPEPAPAPAQEPEKAPIHVSEEPELVREVAEPGAEDGAGATIHVAEPWNGYGRMSAKDVIARAKSANGAQLAAVRLYEARHRSRQTVLAAVDRQLKLSNGSAPA
ncbi:MAG TPA: hypothetical protein VMF57_02380 [Solirubrobacteraceae bacterium]|nr:hypothetical protein [Solirubrobacteraceae bacterium]